MCVCGCVCVCVCDVCVCGCLMCVGVCVCLMYLTKSVTTVGEIKLLVVVDNLIGKLHRTVVSMDTARWRERVHPFK